MAELVTAGRKLTQHAEQRGEAVAAVFAALDGAVQELTWAQLESAANRLARHLQGHGVDEDSFVAIGVPNSLEHLVAAQAAWKLGACATPIGSSLPEVERNEMLALANPAAVIADWGGADVISSNDIWALDGDDSALDIDPVANPFKAIGSGGSTGKKKLIVTPSPLAFEGGVHPLGMLAHLAGDGVLLSPGPLYHNQAFLISAIGLYQGHTVVITERFRPELTLDLIDRRGVTYLNVVPTMMGRMLRSPGWEGVDLSSLQTVMHMAAPCPAWVKQGWIERIGPDKVWELWAATELAGLTMINGSEWLEKPGSVGKPVASALKIIGDDGEELPPGEVGEIFGVVLVGDGTPYAYLGAEANRTVDGGLISVGDMGYLDDDGYLFLADRRVDLILAGGANVYPAEVEAALSSHEAVADVTVVGLPDADLGQRVHAIVVASDGATVTEDVLRTHAAQQLVKYKLPGTYEFVDALPRDEAGKLRRRALMEERA